MTLNASLHGRNDLNWGQRLTYLLPWPSIFAAIFALTISQMPIWRFIELRTFDEMAVLSAPQKIDLPITIISIDSDSLAEIKAQLPWPRRYHANLLKNLKEADVAVVVFDIIFAKPDNDPNNDQYFADTIRDTGSVVLASDVFFSEGLLYRKWARIDPLSLYTDAGALSGLASIDLDIDSVQRKIPTARDSLWRQVLTAFNARFPEYLPTVPLPRDNSRIRYVGGPGTFPYIPFYQMLDPDRYLQKDWRDALKDNIVLIGINLNTATDVSTASDMFQTPFFAHNQILMPGVEVHANIITNMLRGDYLVELPRAWPIMLQLITALLAIFFMRDWRPLRSALVSAILIVIIGLVDLILFSQFFIWLPASATVLTVGLIYIAQGGAAYFLEKQQQHKIREAFSMYVTPTIVDEVLAHPERLKLGGERRELTLLFTDLAGFTAFSESLPPEQVAYILNRYLHEMTSVVLQHSGTVDKFIGDAVMAFWGAPITDAKQALHATQAALEMQARLAAINREFAQNDGPKLNMRIGVHRGDCIVGNMGGETRFDYTAIGDAVNVAARLESTNKIYGTGILLSDTVADKVSTEISLRPVDIVRVKGKSRAVSIYTPENDAELIQLSQKAFVSWHAGQWNEAMKQWETILMAYPDDPIARIFIMRLMHLSKVGWPDHWDGITTLENK